MNVSIIFSFLPFLFLELTGAMGQRQRGSRRWSPDKDEDDELGEKDVDPGEITERRGEAILLSSLSLLVNSSDNTLSVSESTSVRYSSLSADSAVSYNCCLFHPHYFHFFPCYFPCARRRRWIVAIWYGWYRWRFCRATAYSDSLHLFLFPVVL